MYFGGEEKKRQLHYHIVHKEKHAFLGKIKEILKTKKLPSRKKIALELLHQRLGHRSTRSLLAGNTTNDWKDIEIRIDTYPFLRITSYLFHEQKDQV